MIEAQHVAKAFGDKLLFDDLNFNASPEWVSWESSGRNGAGKNYLI